MLEKPSLTHHGRGFFVNHLPIDAIVAPFALPLDLAPWIAQADELIATVGGGCIHQ